MGNKLATYTAYFSHQHLFPLTKAIKTVTPSSAEGALIWTSKFSDFLIPIPRTAFVYMKGPVLTT